LVLIASASAQEETCAPGDERCATMGSSLLATKKATSSLESNQAASALLTNHRVQQDATPAHELDDLQYLVIPAAAKKQINSLQHEVDSLLKSGASLALGQMSPTKQEAINNWLTQFKKMHPRGDWYKIIHQCKGHGKWDHSLTTLDATITTAQQLKARVSKETKKKAPEADAAAKKAEEEAAAEQADQPETKLNSEVKMIPASFNSAAPKMAAPKMSEPTAKTVHKMNPDWQWEAAVEQQALEPDYSAIEAVQLRFHQKLLDKKVLTFSAT